MRLLSITMLLTALFTGSIFAEEKHPAALLTDIIGTGEMPNLAKDSRNNLHLVFGKGDSILYATSGDGGRTFTKPVLVDTLKDLFSFATRGPQIVVSGNNPVILAVNESGDIFSFAKTKAGPWVRTARINDVEAIAKEGFIGVGAYGNKLFAMWLDLREGKNNIYGTRSEDGGKTWSKNFLVYRSPDGHVCECCKPSVAMKKNKVYVMFRNWLNGNRDLYLISSEDGGNTFKQAIKLGEESWQLNACPMDGGSVCINDEGIPQTVWRRKNIIYASEPGKPEQSLGEGRNASMVAVGNKNIYAWVNEGKIVCLLPDGTKKVVGEGNLPVLKAVNGNEVLCLWQYKKNIMRTYIQL